MLRFKNKKENAKKMQKRDYSAVQYHLRCPYRLSLNMIIFGIPAIKLSLKSSIKYKVNIPLKFLKNKMASTMNVRQILNSLLAC